MANNVTIYTDFSWVQFITANMFLLWVISARICRSTSVDPKKQHYEGFIFYNIERCYFVSRNQSLPYYREENLCYTQNKHEFSKRLDLHTRNFRKQ